MLFAEFEQAASICWPRFCVYRATGLHSSCRNCRVKDTFNQAKKMILGVNGMRLVRNRSGVARCIEALLGSMDEMEHPFSEIRVYTPNPLLADIRLPARALNVVLSSPLPPVLWWQSTLPSTH